MASVLRRPDVRQERVDFGAQYVGLAAQRVGCAQHLACGRTGLLRGVADADDVTGNLAGAAGRVLNVAGDLAGRRALFFDRGRDRPGHLVDLGDGGRDVPDGAYGRIRHRLHVDDLLTDFVGRLRGLVGEALHFGGDHRKSAAGV